MITAKYFKESEFKKCSPSCSLQDMDQEFMDILDKLRELAGIPIVINSAYRTKAYEKSKGRPGTSTHCLGKAVDIRCNSNANRYKIVSAAMRLGLCRVGIGRTFVHVDIDPTKSQNVIWHYYDE